MGDLIGKQVECHDMPSSSFYVAVSGTVESVKGDWAVVRTTQVMDRWAILWEDHPTGCLASVLIKNLELA